MAADQNQVKQERKRKTEQQEINELKYFLISVNDTALETELRFFA